MRRHPMQPIHMVGTVARFKENAIVRFLLDKGGYTMNDLAVRDFSNEDRVQFAQLIGYSVAGFGELSYVDNDTYATAERMREAGLSEAEARIVALEATLERIRSHLREAAVAAFQVHPDDLHE